MGMLGIVLVLAVVIGAVFAGMLSPYAPTKIAAAMRFQAPGAAHLLGTDQLGRDLFSRVLFGARIALDVALVSISISFAGGLVLGMIAGYGPRWLDCHSAARFRRAALVPDRHAWSGAGHADRARA